MSNNHINTLCNSESYFLLPASNRQKQYEFLRAIHIDKLSIPEAAQKFGYKINTAYSLIRDFKSGKLDMFPILKKGPKERRTEISTQDKVLEYRKENLSTVDIHNKLKNENISVSVTTIERILKDSGFEKLKRRTKKDLKLTVDNKMIPERSGNLLLENISPFKIDCPIAGVSFFMPYIIESGIIDVIKDCNLPESNDIGNIQANISMLLLKLIGNERLSNMDSYDQEPGLGLFAGLNVLPKSTYMSTYSCLSSEEMLLDFQEKIISQFKKVYPDLYNGDYINLDFHSIPHYGSQSEMEKVWCGSRNKTMKGANTIIAQDSNSNAILYTRADILRKEESQEIKKFVEYWKRVNKNITETLVFDCKFTKYEILDELTNDKIKFITLRKRSEKIVKDAYDIPKEKWLKVNIPIKKRKYQDVSVYEEEIKLKGCRNTFRQIIVKDHGRENPTFVITNNRELAIASILEVYAKRWHVENKISELVSFFNLNALSSPLMIRIHYDIIWTMIADTIYHKFTNDLRRFESNKAKSIFKKFINYPGKIIFDGNKIEVRIRKRSYTPILKGVEKLKNKFSVPWLNNIPIEIIWTS